MLQYACYNINKIKLNLIAERSSESGILNVMHALYFLQCTLDKHSYILICFMIRYLVREPNSTTH